MTRVKDLHLLPKFRDGWSYLYVEHCRIDRDQHAVALQDAEGTVPVPCASLALLMLGPGVSITHAAVTTLADNGCLVLWCGEQGVRVYAAGIGETRSSANMLHQAHLWADPDAHLAVVYNMYTMRFTDTLPDGLTLQQIRGREGIRVRNAYAQASKDFGIQWSGRNYSRDSWDYSDPLNRAISTANSCLYGICHAAILSSGFSPALGFIHTGKQLSFVYDVADLYKTDITIPIAFKEARNGNDQLDRRVRLACRDTMSSMRLLERIIDDMYAVLRIDPNRAEDKFAADESAPGDLWDPEIASIEGGSNHYSSEVIDDSPVVGSSECEDQG